MKKYFFYITILILFSCEKVINVESNYSDERIVFDASIFKNTNEKDIETFLRNQNIPF